MMTRYILLTEINNHSTYQFELYSGEKITGIIEDCYGTEGKYYLIKTADIRIFNEAKETKNMEELNTIRIPVLLDNIMKWTVVSYVIITK
jgi:hypothetical protein